MHASNALTLPSRILQTFGRRSHSFLEAGFSVGVLLILGVLTAKAAPGDENWDDRFAWSLLDGEVRAVAAVGSNVYFGGHIKSVGGTSNVGSGVNATNIARWNGRSWSALGIGVNGNVYAIAVKGNDVFVGGEFTEAGGVSANNLARWDGTNWWPVGGGTDGKVLALAFNGNDLYAGGQFSTAGGTPASNIAHWNGAGWSAVGSGLGQIGSVRAIAFVGADMYACGDFEAASLSGPLRTIARWDGANWNALPGDLGTTSDTAYAMAVLGNDLFVGGTFLTAGGLDTKRIARWNGSWSAVGGGITSASVGVYTLLSDGTNLYASGQINIAGGVTTGNIAKWDGVKWSALGVGLPAASVVYGMAMANDGLYLGGSFLGAGAGEVYTYSTARWDGTNWWALGQGMDNAILVMANDAGHVYAGGWFSRAGGVGAGNLASWNGSRWSSLGNADFLFAEIRAIATTPSNLYIGGTFPSALTNGISFPANAIARWNGTNWAGLGSGLRLNGTNGLVRAIAAAPDGTVYAGGIFTQAGGAAATNIARFYTNWQTVGTAPTPGINGEVLALTMLGNDLYAGGAFTAAGGVSAPGIARWNGSAWSSLGNGLTGTVMTLAVKGLDLYVGGRFTNVSAGLTNIAKWNGSTWAALGGGIGSTSNDFVAAITFDGNDVYVGGNFTNAGSVLANNIARWDGSSWSSLGSGVAPGTVLKPATVRGLAFRDGRLHVGGSFASAGGKPSYGFAIWNPPSLSLPQASLSLLTGGDLVITWNSLPNTSYQVRSTTNLSAPFVPFAAQILATGANTSFTNSNTSGAARFFRIEQLP